MNVSAIANIITMQQCRFYANISMNVFAILNIITTQLHRCYINAPMNISTIANIITMQQCGFYTNIPINTSITTNVLTTQLGTSCSFDSPGLARNEPTPGKRSQGDSTPSVLSFFCEGTLTMNHFMADNAEKAQHLRRCFPQTIR